MQMDFYALYTHFRMDLGIVNKLLMTITCHK